MQPKKKFSFLKSSKDLSKGLPPLSMLLHRQLAHLDPERPLTNIHASELTREEMEYCARHSALKVKTLTKGKPRRVTTSEAVTFQMGRNLQDDVVQTFADADQAIGHWRCLGCEKLVEFSKRPARCGTCKSRNFKPEEVRFRSATFGASCGVDMLWNRGGTNKLTPVEIKTMDKDLFKKLQMPLSEHRTRSTLYLEIIASDPSEQAKFVDTSEIIVLYVSKGGYGCAQDWLSGAHLNESFSPFKEFSLTRNTALVEGYMERSRRFHEFMQTGKMPGGICLTGLSERAKKCDMRVQCWSGKYPAGGEA